MEREAHETKSMYEKRQKVYRNALESGETELDAVVYANVWANMKYMNCKYSVELENSARRYFL
jgi:hypothetical protein